MCPYPSGYRDKDHRKCSTPRSSSTQKWSHVMPLPSAFDSELLRWMNYCKGQAVLVTSSSVTMFSPNMSELLKILAVLAIGSTEAERSFSCICRINSWLRSTMTTSRLSDLAVIAIHSHTTIPIDRRQIISIIFLPQTFCEHFMALHPRRINASSLFVDNYY